MLLQRIQMGLLMRLNLTVAYPGFIIGIWLKFVIGKKGRCSTHLIPLQVVHVFRSLPQFIEMCIYPFISSLASVNPAYGGIRG